uniref:Uncharacterized protein n=1 Tax=Zea mays TaxID=4577 RepID=A0A804UE29_MAIZE
MQADVPPRVPEEVDGGVQLGAVCGGSVQLHAVDPVRAGEDQLQPAADHQRLRVRGGGRLHPPLPRLRAAGRQAEGARLLPPPRRGRLLARRRRHRRARRGAAPRQGARQRLPRLLHGRLRRPPERHLRCDQDEECRVHALHPLLLPHPQRRRLVLVRPLHQGPLRHAPERGRLLLRVHPDGALLLLPEAQAGVRGRPADDDGRRSRGTAAGGGDGAAPRRPPAPAGRGRTAHVRGPGAGRAAEAGGGDGVAAQGRRQGHLTMACDEPRAMHACPALVLAGSVACLFDYCYAWLGRSELLTDCK